MQMRRHKESKTLRAIEQAFVYAYMWSDTRPASDWPDFPFKFFEQFKLQNDVMWLAGLPADIFWDNDFHTLFRHRDSIKFHAHLV